MRPTDRSTDQPTGWPTDQPTNQPIDDERWNKSFAETRVTHPWKKFERNVKRTSKTSRIQWQCVLSVANSRRHHNCRLKTTHRVSPCLGRYTPYSQMNFIYLDRVYFGLSRVGTIPDPVPSHPVDNPRDGTGFFKWHFWKNPPYTGFFKFPIAKSLKA